MSDEYLKGRGAQINTKNKYLSNEVVKEHDEGIDDYETQNSKTQYFYESAKKIVNKVTSPDIGMFYSMNPYQGCEHGCIYCYARNTHEYWGYSAGLDFETKIIIKENAPELLEKQFKNKNWKVHPIMLSGNTDCYQPIEKKLEITRAILQTLLKYKHPVGIITKNALILRDLDILKELASQNLLHVNISITSLNEELRRQLEPRTVSGIKRLKIVEKLSSDGIPVNVMLAPIIPALNSEEIPKIIRLSSEHGASSIAYTLVRLNGEIGNIFIDWTRKNYPDRAEKVLSQIRDCHGGQLSNSRFKRRMRGEGNISESINKLFKINKNRYFKGKSMPVLNTKSFIRNNNTSQLKLW